MNWTDRGLQLAIGAQLARRTRILGKSGLLSERCDEGYLLQRKRAALQNFKH